MTNATSERFERIEANLDRLATLIVQTAERQSVSEHQIDKILAAVAADGENIRALARIAESHQRRIEDIERGSSEE